MRFDLIPKHRAKLANVNVEALKMGQKELKPAITLRFKLTAAATKIGTFGWDDEQTGCTLKIYQGVTGDGDITLKEVTVKAMRDARERVLAVWMAMPAELPGAETATDALPAAKEVQLG